ncbi:MAG: hypothetical protein WDW36_007872 [Sanguina aurantia]
MQLHQSTPLHHSRHLPGQQQQQQEHRYLSEAHQRTMQRIIRRLSPPSALAGASSHQLLRLAEAASSGAGQHRLLQSVGLEVCDRACSFGPTEADDASSGEAAGEGMSGSHAGQFEGLQQEHIVGMLHAFAKAGHRFEDMELACMSLLEAGAPLSDAEQASRLLWSLARTGHTDSELFDTLQPTLAAALPTLPLPCLADLLWAFAKQATVTPLSSSNYRDNASGGSGGGSSIGSVVGSSSRAGRQQRVFSLAQARVIELCSGRGALQPEQQVAHHPSHLSTIAWAYARMGVTPAPLFASLAEAIVRSCTINDKAHAQADGHAPISPHSARQSRQPPADSVTWTAPSVADAAYAFAVAYHRDERLLGVIGQQVMSWKQPLDAQSITLLLWSSAVLGHHATAMAGKLLDRAASLAPHQLQRAGKMQLFQDLTVTATVTVWGVQRLSCGSTIPTGPTAFAAAIELLDLELQHEGQPLLLPPRLFSECLDTWADTQQRASVSLLQKQVHNALQSLHLSPMTHAGSEDGLFWPDIVVNLGGKSVAIEVDGPSHFSVSVPSTMDGSTQLRQRQLARRFPGGVLSIPFHHWDELQGKHEQQEYMQRDFQEMQTSVMRSATRGASTRAASRCSVSISAIPSVRLQPTTHTCTLRTAACTTICRATASSSESEPAKKAEAGEKQSVTSSEAATAAEVTDASKEAAPKPKKKLDPQALAESAQRRASINKKGGFPILAASPSSDMASNNIDM